VAAAEESSHLRAAPGHRRKHHHRAQPAAAGVEQHQQQEQPQSESEQFAYIQKDLIEAWKERTHLEQLQHTIDTQKALLGQQKRLVSQSSEAVSDEERSQFQTVIHMVKSSKYMMTKIRRAAIKKVKDAMSSVMSIDENAGKDMEENRRRIEAANAEIARATAANAKDQQIKQRSQKVLAAAVQEAKYFQTMLSSAKKSKASSVTESAQKEEVSQATNNEEQVATEKTQQNEVSKEKVVASKEDAAGAEKDSKEDATEAEKEDEVEELDEDKPQKEEASQEKAQKEELSEDDAHIKKESLIAVYQQVMHDE